MRRRVEGRSPGAMGCRGCDRGSLRTVGPIGACTAWAPVGVPCLSGDGVCPLARAWRIET